MTAPYILVVEDHDDAREMLVEWLGSLGHPARGLANGALALAHLKAGERPALILLDLMMPVMDGWTFMRAAVDEKLLEGVRVWVISAADRLAPPEGISGFLSKPVDLARLKEVVDESMAADGRGA